MSKPFDAALKGLLEAGPADWVAFLGHRGRSAAVIDADVSAVSAATDKVIRVGGRRPWLLDVNFQTGPDASLPRRMHLYNSLLHERHKLPVRSAVVLLTRDANLKAIDGHYRRGWRNDPPDVEFRYRVVRVWEQSPDALLAGGLSVVPLAPIGAVPPGGLPGVVRRLGQRLVEPDAAELAPEMWAASSILMGLQYDEALVERLIHEVRGMAESVTIKIFERWGALKHSRQLLLRMGAARFGEPPAEVRAAVEGIDDIPYFDVLIPRVNEVGSWAELLATPRPSPPPKPAARRRRPG